MSHTFRIDSEWHEKFSGTIEPCEASPPVSFGVPRDFGGQGGQWTPEHFLAAAVSSCIQATFLSIATPSGVELKAYTSGASCTMTKGASGFEVTAVTVEPRIVVGDEKSKERAERAIEKAEKLCPISKALGNLVSLEAKVEIAEG